MIFAKLIALFMCSQIVERAQALVEVDMKLQLKKDNALNRMYFKGPSGLQMLAAHQNATSANITEEDINDIEEEKELNNYGNVLVYIHMHIGSNQEPYSILFDTGSSWLFVTTRLCDNCDLWSSSYLDERNSTSFSFYPVLMDLQYGSGGIYGHIAYDKVCLGQNKTCANEFSFLAVNHQELGQALPVSGLIGMSPRGGTQNLLIDKIKENNDIDQKVFSIYIDWDNMASKISFGGYNLTKYAHPDHQSLNFVTLTNPNSTMAWFIPFEGMKMIAPKGSTAEQKKIYTNMTIPANQILIDSGTSFVLLPYDERNSIVDSINQINPSFKCTYGQVSICNCGSFDDTKLFPDIQFMIGGRNYFIPVENYILYDSFNSRCYNTLLTVKGLNFYIMGLNFFKNYYTVFDQENMRVGFTMSKVASYRVQELSEMYDTVKNDTEAVEEVDHVFAQDQVNMDVGQAMRNVMKNFGQKTNEIVEKNQETSGDYKDDMIVKIVMGIGLAIAMLFFGSLLVGKKQKVVEAKGEYVVM